MKKAVITVLIIFAVAGTVGVCAYFLLKPAELLGSATVYNKITLQLEDNLFYDVRVPVEAKLESTDGATVYRYDLLTVGVQDIEPTSFCKVKVGNRWVFATSEDLWLKATQVGFEQESAYEGTYDTEYTQWIGAVPKVVVSLDQDILEGLRKGTSYAFGGEEYVTSQIAYGTFDMAVDRALLKMSTLYKQSIDYGMLTETQLWVTRNLYTVAVSPINYNTCLILSAYGEKGKQYAAALMEGER